MTAYGFMFHGHVTSRAMLQGSGIVAFEALKGVASCSNSSDWTLDMDQLILVDLVTLRFATVLYCYDVQR